MKLRLLNIVLLSLIILTVISCDKEVSTSEPEEPPTNGFISVSSNPSNAKIYMNGRNTGSFTPDSLKWLDEGSHSITLKKVLFRDTTFNVDVVENVKNYLDIDYTKNPKMYGSIYCQTEPKGAAVFLDDSITNQVTPTTLRGLWPGDYQIKFQHENVVTRSTQHI